jgi:hypothetical protein
MTKIGNMFPKDPLANALGLGRNLLPNSSGGPFKDSAQPDPSPIASAPVPTPTAPVDSAAAEIIAAQQDIAKQNLMKKSVKKTIFAGDTGGFQGSAPTGGLTAGARKG